jgi:hypothetical protein
MGPGENLGSSPRLGRANPAASLVFPGGSARGRGTATIKRTAMMPSLLQKVALRICDPHISLSGSAPADIICQR